MACWFQLHCFDAAQNANNLALPVRPMCFLSDATVCHLTSSPQPTFSVPPKGCNTQGQMPRHGTRPQRSCILPLSGPGWYLRRTLRT
ncbi:hypothetical protein CKAH01_17544 [Colletotrichum kahawae]|uniref:Uncharacterized protein n=1 Tax=Colletotrichum kahawae TaxID=34407 RepID=A0AAD9Y905_COLKA|nr:hypothetical protein CKAH01_17544 [Colletotrichum kahawae]